MDLYHASPGDTPAAWMGKLLDLAKKQGKRVQLEMRNFRIIADPKDSIDVLERQLAAASLERDMQSHHQRDQDARIRRLERELAVAKRENQMRRSRQPPTPSQPSLVRLPSGTWVSPAAVEQVTFFDGVASICLRSGTRLVTEGTPRQILLALGVDRKEVAKQTAVDQQAAAKAGRGLPCMPPLEIRVLRYMLLHGKATGPAIAEALGERPEAVYQACLQSKYVERTPVGLEESGFSDHSVKTFWRFKSSVARKEAEELYGGPLSGKETAR